jgi:hypothetical protein
MVLTEATLFLVLLPQMVAEVAGHFGLLTRQQVKMAAQAVELLLLDF